MIGNGLGSRRRGYRRGQTAVLFGLATLVLVACGVGPLYERAVEQATIRSTLSSADPTSRALVIGVQPGVTAAQVAPRGRAAALFAAPIAELDVLAAVPDRRRPNLFATLAYRDGACAHLHLAAGRCPSAYGEVVASVPGARALHRGIGGRLDVVVPSSPADVPSSAAEKFPVTVTIVGLYRPFQSHGDYWFDTHYSSLSGVTVTSNEVSDPAFVVDALFGTRALVLDAASRLEEMQGLIHARSSVVVPLQPTHVRIADLPTLRDTVAGLRVSQVHGHRVQLTTSLSQYLDEVDAGRRVARTVILPVALALALLATLAFGVVVAAAAEQRRPELALARLRGNGVGPASRLFVRELGTLALAAVLPGLATAWALTLAACHLLLVPGITPEIRWPVLAAAGGAFAVMIAIIAVIGWRTSGQQITDMLRQLPARSSRLGLGLAEAAIGVAALAGLLASVGGGRRSALAALTPTFVALVVGLLGSRLLVAGARRSGRRALWGGTLVRAIAALNIARRPGGRLTVTVLCVATALLVFAGQQWSVAAANRAQRSAVETGAAVALGVSTPSTQRLIDVVRSADPTQRYATPVVVVNPPGIDAVPTVAVDPASFGAVASWGRSTLRPAAAEFRRLEPPRGSPPVAFTGDALRLRLAAASFQVIAGPPIEVANSAKPSVGVRLDFRRADGQPVQANFGPLPAYTAASLSLSSDVLCDDGCHLTGIEIIRPVLDENSVAVSFTVAGLAAGAPLHLGRARDWTTTTIRKRIANTSDFTAMTARDTPAGLQFNATDDGSGTSMLYRELPLGLPALLAGPKPSSVDSLGYLTGATLDGLTGRVAVVGSIPFVPQVGGAGLVVDLGLAESVSTRLDAIAHPEVWLRTDDPAREKRLVAALRVGGIDVVARHSSAQRSARYAKSAPGWSTLFALVVGVLAVLLAVGLLVLVVLTSRRVRERDLAALRLTGLPAGVLRRATAFELIVFVVVGILAGLAAGLIGVSLSLPAIPIFTAAPAVPLPLTYGLQGRWLAGVLLLSAILLAPVAAAMGARIAGRATADRAVGEAE